MSTELQTVEVVHPRLGLIKVNAAELTVWINERGCSPYGGEPTEPSTPVSVAPAPEVIPTTPTDTPTDTPIDTPTVSPTDAPADPLAEPTGEAQLDPTTPPAAAKGKGTK